MLGSELAGVVEEVGKNVTAFTPGDEVFGVANGSFAEYARASASKLLHKPANLDFAEAAAVPVSATTALTGLRAARLEAGQTVLITGAGGGVGSYAVQLAHAMGAEVTGVCSTAKQDYVRSLGARHVIDHARRPHRGSAPTTSSSIPQAAARCPRCDACSRRPGRS
ncbi:MAG: NAD(P)-dependent alcohol dehydrogenase [Sandaracinaceae bacterium]|nr:NAD(P)-dependent alcohol dehydrogenase [Sandaracinaceae bacterium]